MKVSREEILERVTAIMGELFEIKPESIKLESRLGEDLGLDSIDAIDLITYMQEVVGQRLRPEDFRSVRTVSDLISAAQATLEKVDQKANADEPSQDA